MYPGNKYNDGRASEDESSNWEVRDEWLAKGKLPLQTLRANIDYGEATAFTTYGTIGIKTWIYKGEVFASEQKPARR